MSPPEAESASSEGSGFDELTPPTAASSRTTRDRTDAEQNAPAEHFSVDTSLFRELGELLVGRDSTALIELIKNSYDADARLVSVVASDLGSVENGAIVVTDDGNGMNEVQFRNGFLRVGSRLKSSGTRHSPIYKRQFTGAKGIGRLAAHKLARELQVTSREHAFTPGDVPAFPTKANPTAEDRRPVGQQIFATIDWDEVEKHEVLEDVGDAISLEVSAPDADNRNRPGTTIRMRRLRRAWTARERTNFVREVSTFEPGEAFKAAIAPKHVKQDLLFQTPRVRTETADPGFKVVLGGDFDVGEDYTVAALSAAAWVLEVAASAGTVEYAVAPTKTYANERDLPSRVIKASEVKPGCPDFQARIFTRSGRSTTALSDVFGVRVYMEGFRVLPYGDPGDDWLDINSRYVQRDRGIAFSGTVFDRTVAETSDEDAGLVAPPLKGVFGAVLLTEKGAPDLRMLVNREGFIPDESFLAIRDVLSNGLALQTRVSAALRPDRRPPRGRQPGAEGESAGDTTPETTEDSLLLAPTLDRAVTLVREFATDKQLPPGDRLRITSLADELEHARADLLDERQMLRVLASLGTQTAAFVHEINAALGSIEALQYSVRQMLTGPPSRSQIADLERSVDALKRTLERQAAYLVKIVSPDARRRRSRQRLREHFGHAMLLLEPPATRERIQIDNEISPDLKSPPMFPAELTSLFTNLLSNAIKAAGADGHIVARAKAVEGGIELRIENTGVAVDVDSAETWFDPYQSTSAQVDPSLGQGMGLGLTITRALLREYRGQIMFVPPSPGFATAVAVQLPS